jgi:hypothetical protein
LTLLNARDPKEPHNHCVSLRSLTSSHTTQSPKGPSRMVVFKETANCCVVPIRISTYPQEHRRLRFSFQYLQCQRPKCAAERSKNLRYTKRRLTRPERQPYLVIEESGAYTALFFRVKQFFLKKNFFFRGCFGNPRASSAERRL